MDNKMNNPEMLKMIIHGILNSYNNISKIPDLPEYHDLSEAIYKAKNALAMIESEKDD